MLEMNRCPGWRCLSQWCLFLQHDRKTRNAKAGGVEREEGRGGRGEGRERARGRDAEQRESSGLVGICRLQ